MFKQAKVNFEPSDDGPYIFISYSHRDNPTVIPLLNAFNREGYRIWYDDGLQWGGELYQEIAEHILSSTIFMPLISRALVQSDNCLDEIFYARAEKKNIRPLYLEDNVILPPALKMIFIRKKPRRLSYYGGNILTFIKASYVTLEPCRKKRL